MKAKLYFKSRKAQNYLSVTKIGATHPTGHEMVLNFRSWILHQEQTPTGDFEGFIELHDFNWAKFISEHQSLDYRLVSPRTLSLSFFHTFSVRDELNKKVAGVEFTKIEFVDEFNRVYGTELIRKAMKVA